MLSYSRKHRCACRSLAPPLGSILKRGGVVLHGCYCHYHTGSEDGTVRTFDALRHYSEKFCHGVICLSFI